MCEPRPERERKLKKRARQTTIKMESKVAIQEEEEEELVAKLPKVEIIPNMVEELVMKWLKSCLD